MWWREFKDYPPTSPMISERVESGRGIIGCEMHDLNGWGEDYHRPRPPKKKGLFLTFWAYLFGTKIEGDPR